jgi:hypothetical protein
MGRKADHRAIGADAIHTLRRMTNLFDVPFWELTLEELKGFLSSADAEPLLWEAKGTKLDSHEIRKQCGGFANAERGGYLFLGVSREGQGPWQLEGFEFPDHEPERYVTSCLQEGLRPVPSYDVRAFDVGPGRHVAVVEITPLLAGPCITRGTVYERVAGATIPIRDPSRLGALYSRGTSSHAQAANAAENSSQIAMEAFHRLSQEEEMDQERGVDAPFRTAYVILGVAAVTTAPDLEVRLFRASVRDAIEAELLHLGKTAYPIQPHIRGYVTQDRRVTMSVASAAQEPDWVNTAAWDGSVAVAARLPPRFLMPQTIISGFAEPSYAAAFRLLHMLHGTGPAYSRFWVVDLEDPMWRQAVVVRRGPHELELGAIDFTQLGRELSRAVGVDVAEPEV